MRRIALASALVATVVLLAAGCGGGGSDQASPEEQWANDVCSSIVTWKTEIEGIVSDTSNAIKSPADARAALESAVDDGKTATETLVSDLKSLTPPGTPEDQQAKQALDTFADELQTTASEAQAALSGLSDASSLADITKSLSGLGAQLQATLTSGEDLVTSLESAGGAIKDGFENASSCKDLRNGS